MKKIQISWVAVAVTMASVGCLPKASPIAPKPRSLGEGVVSYRAPHDRTGAGKEAVLVEEPAGVLTLRRALALALMQNPALASSSWEVRVREAQTLQAGLRPNPELAVEVENVVGSGGFKSFDAAETSITLGQLIELGGKRIKRERVAALEEGLALWDYEVQRIDVLTQVAQAFVAVLAAQERLALAEQLVEIGDQSLRAVAKQVKAGAASSVERTRAEVSVATTRVERDRAAKDLAAARSQLAATWASRTPTFTEVTGELYTAEAPPPAVTLKSQILQNPELARWVEEIELRQAVVALEDARRIPDVTVTGGPRHFDETDDNALIFGLSFPLPVFDRNQGATLAARRDLAKAGYERQAAEVRVTAAFDVAYQQLLGRFEEVVALRERILPQAQVAFDGVQRGYLQGLFRYVEVLDAQRTLFELRGRQLDALEAYHVAVAEIERLTGEPLEVGAEKASTP